MRGFVRNYTKDDWSQGPKSFKRTWEEGGWAARCVEGGGKGEGKGEEIGGGGREGRGGRGGGREGGGGGGGGGRESRVGGEKAGCEPKLVAWAPYAVHPIKAKIYFQVFKVPRPDTSPKGWPWSEGEAAIIQCPHPKPRPLNLESFTFRSRWSEAASHGSRESRKLHNTRPWCIVTAMWQTSPRWRC